MGGTLSKYPSANLDINNSDHRALKVSLGFLEKRSFMQQRPTRFRFEALWLEEEEFASIVSKEWSTSFLEKPVQRLLHNFQGVSGALN